MALQINGKTENLISTEIQQTRTYTNSNTYAANIAEEMRQERIKEYKNLINEIKQVTSKILNANEELKFVQETIEMYIAGKSADIIENIVETAQEGIVKIVDNLNSIGRKAANKIKNEGETCTYEEASPDIKSINNSKTKTIFSCDTNLMRQKVLAPLKSTYNRLDDTFSNTSRFQKLEGCEDVNNVSFEIDDIKDVVNKAYKSVEEFIRNVEEKEKENISIINGLFNRFGKIFNENGEKVDYTKKNIEMKNSFYFNSLLNKHLQNKTDTNLNEKNETSNLFDENITYNVTYNKLKGNLKGYSLSIPSTIDSENKPKNMIIDLHGKGGATWTEEYFKENSNIQSAISNSALKKPNAIILSPQLRNNSDTAWYSAEQDVVNLVDEVLNEYEIERQDVSITVIRT